METRILPGPLVMTPGGIKHTPVPLGTHPGPRLLIAVAQHRAVLLVMHLVHIGFIPAGKPIKTRHDFVISLGNARAEGAHPMGGKSPAQQTYKILRVAEIARSRMHRHKPPALFHTEPDRQSSAHRFQGSAARGNWHSAAPHRSGAGSPG